MLFNHLMHGKQKSANVIKVSNGDYVAGMIAGAQRILGATPDIEAIKTFLKMKFVYDEKGIHHIGATDINNNAMSNYFETSLPTSSYEMNKALDNNQMIYGTVLSGSHAILITNRIKVDSKWQYNFYDPVAEKGSSFPSISFFDNWIIIKGLKK